MNVENKEELNTSKCRIPKLFNPESYDIDLYVDFYDLTYKIFEGIDLCITNHNSSFGSEILVINATDNYKINNVYCLGDKLNSENFSRTNSMENINSSSFIRKRKFSEENLCDYFFSKDILIIINIFKKEFSAIQRFNDLLKLYDEKTSKEKLKLHFIKFLENLDSSKIIKHEKIFILKSLEFDIFEYMINSAKKIPDNENQYDSFIKEETIYVKLPRAFSAKEKPKIFFEVEGKIRIDKSFTGFYISIWGEGCTLLENDENKLKEIWRDDYDQKKLLKDSVFCMSGEPVEFRTVFPCFDEPCFKSRFNLRVSVEKNSIISDINQHFNVLSNGELEKVEEKEYEGIECFRFTFSQSPLMSIYLLTWVIGYFEYISKEIKLRKEMDNMNTVILSEENINENLYKINIRSFFPLHRRNESIYSLDLAEQSLIFYSKYFQIPYTFSKLDLVPLPDFSYRALESWGCIIFKHYALLSTNTLNLSERKLVSRTIVHEISHMWFGNLVTMEWWDDIWLNEGFARFLEFECLKSVRPELNLEYNFINLIFSQALHIDESTDSHPVIGDCPSPQNLPDIFDTISYAKGASILRMFNNFIGGEQFKLVISEYLKTFQFSNTKTNDLWDMFLKYSNIDLTQIMSTWTKKSGHPCIFVSLCDKKENLIMEQMPYPKDLNDQMSSTIWEIPLFIRTKDNDKKILMKEKKIIIKLKDLSLDKNSLINGTNFVKLNFDMKGFYRVFYLNDSKYAIDYSELENIDLNQLDYNLHQSKHLSYLNFLLNSKDKNIHSSPFSNIYIEMLYNKGLKTNILLKALLKNIKHLSTSDIAGLLEDYRNMKDFSTCIFILDQMDTLEENDYVLLTYAENIFKDIQSNLRPYLSFRNELCSSKNNEFIDNEFLKSKNFTICKIYEENYEKLFISFENINKIFLKLFDNQKFFEILIDKLYNNYSEKSNFVEYNGIDHDFNDEFYDKMLIFIYYLTKFKPSKSEVDEFVNCKIIILHILENFGEKKANINKNLKINIYKIANNFSYLIDEIVSGDMKNFNFNCIKGNYLSEKVLKISEKYNRNDLEENFYQIEFYKQIIVEFIENFYEFSLSERSSYKFLIANLENSSFEKFFILKNFASKYPLKFKYLGKEFYTAFDSYNRCSIKNLIDFKIKIFFFEFFLTIKNSNEKSQILNNLDNYKILRHISKDDCYELFKNYYNFNKERLFNSILSIMTTSSIFDLKIFDSIFLYSHEQFERNSYEYIHDFKETHNDQTNFKIDLFDYSKKKFLKNNFSIQGYNECHSIITQLINYFEN